jgi:cold shock protein
MAFEEQGIKMEDNKVYIGQVIWFGKGIGFIAWDIDGIQQKDMFIHYSDISIEGYKTLSKDQKVSFEIGTNNRGQPKAINVIVIK